MLRSKKLHSLEDLLIHQLKDIYYAEKQIHKGLGKLIKAATNEQLRDALTNHREETAEHITRLEQAFSELGLAAKSVKCPAIEGIIKETNELVEESGESTIMDAAIISSAQRVEHYEIAAYGCIRSFAEQLGYQKIVKLVQSTLDEEGAADHLLSQIAESTVNPSAVESHEESAV